jgi:hypothetical protein
MMPADQTSHGLWDKCVAESNCPTACWIIGRHAERAEPAC